jgi:hypothetical protein
MRKSILAAASVVALGMSSFGADAALTMAGYGIPATPQTTGWMAGYGVPATPAQMARVSKELASYRQVASGQQHAQNGTTIRELEFPGG